MISRVVIKNFKSIGEPGVDLELKPLTLLVGPNGGGKSSILEAIAVASQGRPNGRLASFPSWGSIKNGQVGQSASVDVYFDWSNNARRPGYRVTADQHMVLGEESEDSSSLLRQFRSSSFFISSVRGDIPYETPTGSNPQWVGFHGQDLVLLLAVIFGHRSHDEVAERIAGWASRFGIGGLKAGFWGGNQVGSDYQDSKLEAVLDLALASSGSKQILTVITQLFWSPAGSLLMIEEPEISLHPQAQVDVLEMFGEALRENKQIIATTHSIIMLQALGYGVLKGWLTPDQLAVYHIEKGDQGTTAKLLPLSETGYIQDWVPSFTEVERHLLLEWSKTLSRE